MFDRVSYDRGVHLRGTPLWLDAERKRPLCILTGLGQKLPPAHERVVASAELAEVLTAAGYKGDILPAPWERWVGVGGRQIQLLHADARPGAAVVQVAAGRETIVVAGLLRRHMMRWPRAHALVAAVPALAHRGAEPRQVVRGVAMFLGQARDDGVRAAVLVDSLEVALEVQAALAEEGFWLAGRGLVGKLIGEAPEGVADAGVLALAGARLPARARVAWVDSGLGGKRPQQAPHATFRLRWWADWSTLRHAVGMTDARKVALVAPPTLEAARVRRHLGAGVEARLLGRAQQLDLLSA